MKMERNRSLSRLCVVGILVAVLLVGVGLAVQASAGSFGRVLGIASRPIKGGKSVIATINGEPLDLQALERTRTVLQANSQVPLNSVEAYKQAFDQLVRNRVLIQEARRRGLKVTEQEARDYLAQIQATAKQSPELAQMLEDEARAFGGDEHQFKEQMVAAYHEGLLIQKLYEALNAEAPLPSDEEVDIYLTRQPGPNAIVLIPIMFQDSAIARSTYAELQSLASSQSPDQFTTTFDGYARRLGKRQPGEFVHQTFRFADETTELPDYAQAALESPEGSIGLFERADGTAVVYLVLKSVATSAEKARAAAKAELVQERQRTYADEVERRLVNQAKVHIFQNRLPQVAQAALTSR